MASPSAGIDPEQGHRLWAASYDTDVNPLLALARRVLRPHLDQLSGKRLADVGCGTGAWMAEACPQGADVFGFDLTPEMLARAAAKPSLARRLVLADASALPLADGVADVTLCSFCLSYVNDRVAAWSELGRVTRAAGRVIVSDIHPLAIAAGWRRTFRSAGRLYDMEPQGHAGNPLRAGAASGLTLWRVLEPSFGEPERELFEQAGKADEYETVSRIPALLITLWDRVAS